MNYCIMPIAWIPNALSLGNLSLGFLSILIVIQTSLTPVTNTPNQLFFFSGILILVAFFIDGFDGLVARKLKVESAIGEQLDSLADLTTFGLAPAVLMYTMYLKNITIGSSYFIIPIGGILAMIYPICTAFRLARFNVSHAPDSFIGLPSPIGGAMVALSGIIYQFYNPPLLVTSTIFLLLALLMVSNIKYHKPTTSIKHHFTGVRLLIVLSICIVLILWFKWYWVFLTALIFYIFSGLVVFTIHQIQKIKLSAG